MNKLTPQNYYEKNNKALTCSKIKDFARCPYYFFRKNIEGSIQEEQKDSFIFGGIVDKLLSGESFDTKYQVAEGVRTAKKKQEADDKGVTLITQLQYDEIFNVADAVEKTEAWKDIKSKAKMQEILQVPMDLGEHFDCLAGKPDFYWIDNGTCYLVDLKTSVTTNHKKYYYQAIGFKYHWQLANYEMLLEKLYQQNIADFRSFNLVVNKEKNVYGVELFEYPRSIISKAKAELLETIYQISHTKEFKKYNPSFKSPVTFGYFEENEPGEYEDE